MIYITVRQSPHYHQMTLDELLFGEYKEPLINNNYSNTRTYKQYCAGDKIRKTIKVYDLVSKLSEFNVRTEQLRSKKREDLYYSFSIPKRSGGLRRIDAPNAELKNALYDLKDIFENDFHALYHTSAFAYIKNRSTLSCVKRHQENNSRWYAKFDLSNFFGSITLDWTMSMLSMIFPFSEVIKTERGKAELEKAIELAFLNGGLPQGTPISPLITNILMIPVDFEISNKLREFEYEEDGKKVDQKFVYTRYADDFIISSRYDFRFRDIEKVIKDIMESFKTPFSLNEKKTRYGSSSGRNWNLGVMVNKDNEITVGHQKKKQFQNMLASYIMDSKNGKAWDLSDIQTMEGYRSYYRMVEGEVIDRIIEHIDSKFGVDVVSMIKSDIKKYSMA